MRGAIFGEEVNDNKGNVDACIFMMDSPLSINEWTDASEFSSDHYKYFHSVFIV